MDLVTMVYLADVVENFTAALIIFSVIFVLCAIFSAIALSEKVISSKPLFSAIGCFVFTALLAAALPSKEGVYTMAAAKGVEIASSSPDVKRLAGKSLDVLEKAMDKYLEKAK